MISVLKTIIGVVIIIIATLAETIMTTINTITGTVTMIMKIIKEAMEMSSSITLLMNVHFVENDMHMVNLGITRETVNLLRN